MSQISIYQIKQPGTPQWLCIQAHVQFQPYFTSNYHIIIMALLLCSQFSLHHTQGSGRHGVARHTVCPSIHLCICSMYFIYLIYHLEHSQRNNKEDKRKWRCQINRRQELLMWDRDCWCLWCCCKGLLVHMDSLHKHHNKDASAQTRRQNHWNIHKHLADKNFNKLEELWQNSIFKLNATLLWPI